MNDMLALDFMQAAVRMACVAPIVILGDDEDAARWVEATRLGAIDFIITDADGHYLSTLAPRLAAAHARTLDRDSSARLADALASTASAVLIADRSGRVQYLNPACARLLGRQPDEARSTTLSESLPLEDEPGIKADLFAAVDVGGEWAGELEVRSRQGERVPCIVTLSPIRRVGGRIDGLGADTQGCVGPCGHGGCAACGQPPLGGASVAGCPSPGSTTVPTSAKSLSARWRVRSATVMPSPCS